MNKKTQKSGSDSTNFQAEDMQVHVHNGLTYSDARQISLDVMKAELSSLTEIAYNTAIQRAEKYSDKLLEQIKQRSPELLQTFVDPAIQLALKDAQKEYISSPEENFAEITIDLLMDRMECKTRDRISLVLDDALRKANRLTENDLNTFSLVFALKNSKRNDLGNDERLREYLYLLSSLVKTEAISDASFKYMESLGCISVAQFSTLSMHQIFRKTYPGLFAKGFPKEKIPSSITPEIYKFAIVPCINDKMLLQVNAVGEDVVEKWFVQNCINQSTKLEIISLLNNYCLDDEKVKEKVLKLCPPLEKTLTTWEEKKLGAIRLTSAGIVLAIANLKKKTNQHYHLPIWIN